ncbi:MAG: hypothetical protein WAV90_00445 [Gordonia amarae]
MTSTRITASAKALAAAALALALAVTGCSTSTNGTPTAAPPTSSASSTSAATTTTTTAAQAPGLRTDAIAPSVTFIETAPGAVNDLVQQALSDVIGYWQSSGMMFTAPSRLEALPGPIPNSTCMRNLDEARRCDEGIGWSVPAMTAVKDSSGDLGVLTIIAHEVGHEVQSDSYQRDSERGADCLAGAYLRTVADGKSERFVGTRSDIESAAQTMFDAIKGSETAPTSERMSALRSGMDKGTASNCFIFYP